MRAERRSPRRVALGTVLVVDDAADTRRLLRRALEVHGFAVVEATDGEHALEACRHESLDVIVLDLDFGSGPQEGLDTLRSLKESPRTMRTPIVVMSDQGAEELVARVRAELAQRARQRDLEERADALDAVTSTDPLTALGNRRALEAEVAQMRSSIGRDGRVNVFLIDLDHFKVINDNNGHLVGDAVLRIAARRLATVVGGSGALVRWGGEEFLAVVADAGSPEAMDQAERLRLAISATPFTIAPGDVVPLTASVGATSASLAEFDRGVERAAEALYVAKSAGRDRVAFV